MLLLVLLFSLVFSDLVPHEVEDAFLTFKIDYNRQYNNFSEEQRKLGCFYDSWLRIQQLNTRERISGGYATFGINNFADQCKDEFARSFGLIPSSSSTRDQNALFDEKDIIQAKVEPIDWRAKGAVAAVKDQGICGGCWAFSSTGAIEGAWVVAGNKLVSLSEQELIDCTFVAATGGCPGGITQNQACNGGNMKDAMDWVVKNGGIDSEKNQPYLDHDAAPVRLCNGTGCRNVAANISSVQSISKHEDEINAALHKYGPLSIAVSGEDLQHYTGGIMTNCFNWGADHGVVLVGYNPGTSITINETLKEKPYWIIKNSWGAKWGEKGFFRVQYGTNQCDMNSFVNAAIV